MIDILLIILAMVVLLLMQGFFSGAEIALVHADRLKLQHLASRGSRGAALVLRLFHRPEVLLGTTLVGTNLSLVALTTLGTILMIRLFGEYGDLYAFLVFTPIFLIFGEVVPKSAYQQKAESIAPIIVYPLRFFSWLFYPVVFVFSWVARMAARLAGVDMSHRELYVNREQIRSVIEMSEKGANIDVFDRDRIMRVVRYADATVGDVMIPITEMTTIGTHQSMQHAIQLARQRAHFRLPVYENEHNQIAGIVSFTMWDLMNPELADHPLSDYIQPALNVSENQSLDELLPDLQQRKDHMAVVIDEYGSAVGMCTIEDVLEVVVGEVMNVGYSFEGYLPRQKHHIEKIGNEIFSIDGRVSISEANDVLNIRLSSAEVHTVGGMIITRLKHIPKQGESVILEGYRFTVEEVDSHDIQKLHAERV